MRSTDCSADLSLFRRSRVQAVAISLLMVVLYFQLSVGGQVGVSSDPETNSQGFLSAISGVVVDQRTSAPISGAVVVLSLEQARTAANRRQLTDDRGRFVFTNLSPGIAIVSASKPGYLESGSVRDSHPIRFSVRDKEWLKDVRVALYRPGGLDGTVVDEAGEPIVGVWVRLLTSVHVAGNVYLGSRGLTQTDDRGRYRFGGLPPGEYVAQVPVPIPSTKSLGRDSAVPVPSRVFRFPVPPPAVNDVVFSYPSALSDPVTVNPDEQRGAVDISLRPMRAFRVSGALIGPSKSLQGLRVRLLRQLRSDWAASSEEATAAIDRYGRFTFVNVPEGHYFLDVTGAMGELRAAPGNFDDMRFSNEATGANIEGIEREIQIGSPGVLFRMLKFEGATGDYWARENVDVRGDVSLTVVLRQPGVLRGRIVKDLTRDAPVPEIEPSVGIELDPADGSPALGTLRSASLMESANDRFTIRGILHGNYFLRTRHGWTVKSIYWNSRNFTDAPFDGAEAEIFDNVEVVVTNGGAAVLGAVVDDRGLPVHNATVLLFPTSDRLWEDFGLWPSRIRATSPTNTGEYDFKGVPAGEYYAVAIEGQTPVFGPELFRLAQQHATRISLSWSQVKTVNLTMSSQRR
jgi:hypothetical protein